MICLMLILLLKIGAIFACSSWRAAAYPAFFKPPSSKKPKDSLDELWLFPQIKEN